MAHRIYVSDWAYTKITEFSEELDMPMHMVVDEAVHLYVKSRKEG